MDSLKEAGVNLSVLAGEIAKFKVAYEEYKKIEEKRFWGKEAYPQRKRALAEFLRLEQEEILRILGC